MSTAFVICSRRDSSRVPTKAFNKYAGKTHLQHLIERLLPCDIPIYVAVPEGEEIYYSNLMDRYAKRVFVCAGFGNDPLRRMHGVAKDNKLKTIIRVTHDKIFVNENDVFKALGEFKSLNLDYLYSSSFIPGTAFEIIDRGTIEKSAMTYKRVEHISYAVKAMTQNQLKWGDVEFNSQDYPSVRLLVDYPEDVELMHVIFSSLGSDCTLDQVLKFIAENPWLNHINRLPKVTVYTCAYNAEKWIEEAMGSVAQQSNFGEMEYILIDDCSSDRTVMKMAKFCQLYKNAKWFANQSNQGLASSSNMALRAARGAYIVRLDADDYLCGKDSIQDMVDLLDGDRHLDAIYPNNYVGVGRKSVQSGKEHHHIGGTLFRTSAINHVKFTEGMRQFEGLDFFTRAQKQISIGYLNKPIFVYRQHDGSMSKTNLEERRVAKHVIEEYLGKSL